MIDVIELDRAGAADAVRLVANQQRVARSANAVVPGDLIEQHVAESHLATLLERGFTGSWRCGMAHP